MANNSTNATEDARLAARRDRMAGTGRKRRPNWIILLLIILFLFAAVFVAFPDQARRLLGLDTSSSEDIQRTSQVDNSGISTQIEPQPTIVIERPPEQIIVPPSPDDTDSGLSDEALARLAALEKTLQDLANRPTAQAGLNADGIKSLLDQQAAALRAEAETRERLLQSRLDALQAQQSVPSGPTAEELAEQERLRLEAEERERLRQELAARKAERDAELMERQISDGNVFDESEEGVSTSGTKEDETGVRELSRNEQFLQSAASQGFETAQANSLGDISNMIVQGTIISAVLETAINTELPGNIRAQVMRPVYSFDGQNILMPAGTRLIGTYNSEISIAQRRVLIAWNRAITPQGKSVTLAATGIDRLGRGGQAGNVDSRFVQRFGTAALITSLAAIPSFLANGDASGGTTSSDATDVAQDVSNNLRDTTEDVLEDYLNLPPILRIPQGTPLNVLVNQDLDFT